MNQYRWKADTKAGTGYAYTQKELKSRLIACRVSEPIEFEKMTKKDLPELPTFDPCKPKQYNGNGMKALNLRLSNKPRKF